MSDEQSNVVRFPVGADRPRRSSRRSAVERIRLIESVTMLHPWRPERGAWRCRFCDALHGLLPPDTTGHADECVWFRCCEWLTAHRG